MGKRIATETLANEPADTVGGGPASFYESHAKIYPRSTSGLFQNLRIATIWVTLSIYFVGPWLRWGDRQAVLFDLPARQFHIFGYTFWPQDFVLLAWALIIAAFALFFFTNLAGRLWCGYTCPQTVWTKIFIGIEHYIEGERHQRIRLDQNHWTTDKVLRKTIKHTLWAAIGFVTGLTFVGYFTPIGALLIDLFTLDANGWAFFWVMLFTILTYLNAGWLREQVCIYMCPYARFQSVMFDKDTLVISYDAARGETRGSRKRNAERDANSELGDCIDCNLCVQVCPTGIDIRDGLQYECIGCAACIDACDGIMDKMGYDRGLVRYTTEHELSGGKTHILRPRLVGYGTMLLVMCIAFLTVFFGRTPVDLNVLRDRNQLYRTTSEGLIENSYTLKVINKAQSVQRFAVSVVSAEPDLKLNYLGDNNIDVAPGEVLSLPVSLQATPNNLKRTNIEIEFVVRSEQDPDIAVETSSRFLSPPR